MTSYVDLREYRDIREELISICPGGGMRIARITITSENLFNIDRKKRKVHILIEAWE